MDVMRACVLVARVAGVLLLTSCAAGSVRQARVGGLGRYPEAGSIAVAGADTSVPLGAAAAAGARRAFEAAGMAAPELGDAGAGVHLTLRLAVLAAEAPAGPLDTTARVFSLARSVAGFAGQGEGGAAAGRLELEGRLFAPDGREVGYVRWESEGTPEAIASEGGEEAGRALARLVPVRRREIADRRVADERLLLTPTPMTLEPGEVLVSDDEILLARVGAGLSPRLQLDLWAGGFPIPGAAAVGGAGHGLVGAGVAGVIVLGFFDLGLKAHVLDETRYLPGVAIAYDLLDVFGLGTGGVGVVVVGNGAGGGGFGAVAGANAQFNLFTLVAGKHFGPVQLTAGSYVLDNHHYLPQSAAFQGGCAGAATDGSTSVAGVAPCGSGSASLGRLPVQLQPFAGGELVLGPHSSLMIDALVGKDLESTVATSGVRWLLGWSRPHGLLALDRIRVRLDLAALWLFQSSRGGSSPHGARAVPLPWAGVGFYFL
jgi:hypothetical protein